MIDWSEHPAIEDYINLIKNRLIDAKTAIAANDLTTLCTISQDLHNFIDQVPGCPTALFDEVWARNKDLSFLIIHGVIDDMNKRITDLDSSIAILTSSSNSLGRSASIFNLQAVRAILPQITDIVTNVKAIAKNASTQDVTTQLNGVVDDLATIQTQLQKLTSST